MTITSRKRLKWRELAHKSAECRDTHHCSNFELDGQLYPMDHLLLEDLKEEYEQLSADGFRVLAIASKDMTPLGVVAGDATPYSKADECDLILNGYVAFLDPPKETATEAIKALEGHGVAVKVVTGDNDLVATNQPV